MASELAINGGTPVTTRVYRDIFTALGREEVERVTSLLARDEISVIDGSVLDEFEIDAARFFGNRYGVGMCNGTCALHAAYFALGLTEGDEVIVPVYGYHATVVPLCELGVRPVFCDIDPNTLTIDPDEAAKLITPKTKAIVAHHPWGSVANIEALLDLKRKFGIRLVSDSSHAHGAEWKGQPLGRYFDILCASFGRGKLITGGELGVVVTDDATLRDRLLLYGHANRVPAVLIDERLKEYGNAVGIKYRPHPLALGIAIEQMRKFPTKNEALLARVQELTSALEGIPGFLPLGHNSGAKSVCWKFTFALDPNYFFEKALVRVVDALIGEGIPVRKSYYSPLLHQQPVFERYHGVGTNRAFPRAADITSRLLHIANYVLISPKANEEIVQALVKVSRHHLELDDAR